MQDTQSPHSSTIPAQGKPSRSGDEEGPSNDGLNRGSLGNHPFQRGVAIRGLLLEGWAAADIARKLKISHQAVGKHVRRLVEKGQIAQVSAKPAQYIAVKGWQPPIKPVGLGNQTIDEKQPLTTPAKVGASFALVGRPPLQYNDRGKAMVKEMDHLAQFGRQKAWIWIKHFRGDEPDEIKENARRRAIELGEHYAAKFGIKLTFLRLYDDIEWVIASRQRSARIAASAGIKKGEQLEMGDTIHKMGDSSHPWWLQMNNAPGAPPVSATFDAKTHFYLYKELLPDLEKREKKWIEREEAHQAEADRLMKLFGAMSDAVITINQRLMKIEQGGR